MISNRLRLAVVLLPFVAACGFPKTSAQPPALSADQVAAAVKQSPGVTEGALTSGKTLFTEKCNGCHGYPELASIPAEGWPSIMKEMAEKSGLSAEQEAHVLQFVLAARAPSKP